MPGVLIGIVGAVTAQYVGVTLAYGIVAGAVVGAIVSSALAGILFDDPMDSSITSSAQQFLSNKPSNNAPIPIVYGNRTVGGTIVTMASFDDGLYLGLILVLSEGEISNVLGVLFNGTTIDFEDPEDAYIRTYFGSTSQQGDSIFAQTFTDYSMADHRLAGTAYLAVALKFNPEIFPSGAPVITALVKGVKVYDPRAPGGGFVSGLAWSNNPALCVRDYLTNPRYGRGIENALIDDASFITAANYCDELVAYDGTNFIKRYQCNGVVETSNGSLDIIKKLLTSCRGLLVFSAGLYKLIIDKPEIPQFTFSEDNIIGGWNIKLGSKNSRYNRIRANFFNSEKNWQPDIAVADSETLRQEDGVLLEKMIDLPFTWDVLTSRIIATIAVNQSRQSITCEFTATIEGLRVEVGDVVYIKHATPGWDTLNSNQGKKFRVMRITLQHNDEVRILAAEYADEVYDFGIIEGSLISPSTDLSDLSTTLPPTNLNLIESEYTTTSGVKKRIDINWTASIDGFIDSYEVQWGDGAHWFQLTNTKNTSARFNDPAFLRIYIRVRAINIIGVASEWLF